MGTAAPTLKDITPHLVAIARTRVPFDFPGDYEIQLEFRGAKSVAKLTEVFFIADAGGGRMFATYLNEDDVAKAAAAANPVKAPTRSRAGKATRKAAPKTKAAPKAKAPARKAKAAPAKAGGKAARRAKGGNTAAA